MAYRGGGGQGREGRGYQDKHGGGRGTRGGGDGATGWPPPPASSSSVPRPAAPAPYTPAVAIYHNPNATGPHQGAYQHGVVFRGPAPPAVRAPSSTPVTIRAPSPTPATVRTPAPTPSPAAPPFQPARVSAPAPAPPTPAAAVAKELEQKLFVTETALAPPAAAAAAAVAATQVGQAEAEKAPEVDLAPVSKKGLAHPARPGAGTVGKKVMIRANHFLVNVADNNLFHYDVSINPESKSRAVNREVLSELIKLHGKTSLGGKLPAYDGRKSLYTAGSLPFESEEFSVTLVDPEKKDKERAEREYKITIRIAGRTDLYHLQQFLKGRQRDMPQETIQVLDVVLRESPSWKSFFSTTFGHRGDIGEGLQCWRGYYQSLRPTQMGLSLNIDISAASFFKPVTVVQFVLEFLNLRDASRPLTDRDRVKIKKALRGVRVETNHQEDQIRRYKITGITPIPMSQIIFPVDERGTRMSVVQYFMQRYNYNLQYTSWPCLQSGSNARPVYLPMEACKIVEGQRYSKKLNDKQVTNILRATCQRPQQREQSIREMVLHNKYAEDKFAQEFGINVCSDLVSVPAHVLSPPMLRYHDSGKVKTCAPSVGQWNMINKFVNPRSLVHNGSVLERAFVRNGTPFVSEVPTIIFGADVTHPPPGEDSASSIASVVASMDWPAITKYRGLVSAQPHRQEIIEDLFSVTKDPQRGNVNGGMIRELLIAFRRKTGRRPERIVYYRDGVSEGQFSHVLLHEMDAIRKACASLEEGYMPPVTFVIVRHHIRLDIPKFHGRCDTSDKSGTILTETLADETKYVFSLCKDADIQGTSRPTHYHVLYDENHYTADALQSLTNNLCYTSVRCTRATSVVLPAYYAHLRAVICARYNVEGDSLDGGSTPRSSGQAAITREGHVEVRQVPKIKENVKDLPGGDSPGIKWRGTNIFIDTPVGRMTVDVPLKNSCYSLKIAIEKKLGVSIDRCTLKTSCGIPIEYNHTLEYYGLKNLSVLSMGVKLLGGADMYEIEAETLHEYANDSARFFDTEVIPHITRPNEWQQVELMNKIGCGIGRDVTGTFMKAAQEKLSWGGQIELTDFIVVDDQVILRKQPTEELTESNFSLDCGQLRSFMVQIFNAQQKKVFFMDDFLDTLQVAQRSSISWLIPYLTTHYVFKTPLERGNTSCNLFGFFEDLSDEIKESFRNDLRFIFCFDWTSMKCQLSYLFQPTLHYHKKGKPKANYSSRGFGPFHFQRNFNMHSNVMAPHLKDVAIALLMGDYMCRVIRHLLMKGWYIHKIIGA